MSDSYFIQTTEGKWEEVDAYIWGNSQKVVNEDGQVRYGENRFAVVDSKVTISMSEISVSDLGIIARIAGASIPTGSVQGGLVQKPNGLLRIKANRGMCFYDVNSGNKFKKVA